MAENKPKVAVIGAGYWGKKHIEEYVLLGVDVTAVDLSDDRLKYCSDKFGVKTSKDLKSILADPAIKAVSICTPNQTHYSIAKASIIAGKHVLVEKPLSMTIEEGKELIDLSKDGSILAVGHIFRFNNAINKLKEMIDGYELGDIRIVEMKWTNAEPLFQDRDVIFDLAPHPFDIINYLFKKNPDEVSCMGNAYRRSKNKGVECVYISCKLDETIINIQLSWLTPPKTRSLVVVGSLKSAIVNCTAQTIKIVEGNKSYDLEIVQNNTISDELRRFLKCIENNSCKNISNGEAGLDTIKMIEVCQRSLNEKKMLRFEWN